MHKMFKFIWVNKWHIMVIFCSLTNRLMVLGITLFKSQLSLVTFDLRFDTFAVVLTYTFCLLLTALQLPLIRLSKSGWPDFEDWKSQHLLSWGQQLRLPVNQSLWSGHSSSLVHVKTIVGMEIKLQEPINTKLTWRK